MKPTLAVLIPVGPGHERYAARAVASVWNAWMFNRGPWGSIGVHCCWDLAGVYGRSKARNVLMNTYSADWHFLLDADDRMTQDALRFVDFDTAATFGAVCLSGTVQPTNVYPCTRGTLLNRGARGTLAMGCFVQGDLGLRFNEDLDAGEDYDFYLRLPSFTKHSAVLVDIDYDAPSATGPRAAKGRWFNAVDHIVMQYRDDQTPVGALRCLSCGKQFINPPHSWSCTACNGMVSRFAGQLTT